MAAAWTGHAAAILIVLCLALMLAAPVGFRLRLWSAATALTKVVALGLVSGLLAALAALVSLILGGWRVGPGTTLMLVAIILIGGLAVLLPLRAKKLAEKAPIRDITTDPERPPAFAALTAARAADGASSDYPGGETAAIQRANYPDLAPLHLDLPPEAAFARAREAAQALGWRIGAADVARGHLEASDRTRLFGFVDDIVMRLAPEGSGTRIDWRSASRVGISDLGKNAERIRACRRLLAAGG